MYKEPEYLIKYRDMLKAGPPKCCHTCEDYDKRRMFCYVFKMIPPEDFAATQDACHRYSNEIPF